MPSLAGRFNCHQKNKKICLTVVPRLLKIFLVKNSSPFFSKLVRVWGPNHYILLIGTIKPYNICYWHFLLRSFLSKIFNDPFHQTKKGETNKTVSKTTCFTHSRWSQSWRLSRIIVVSSTSLQPSL